MSNSDKQQSSTSKLTPLLGLEPKRKQFQILRAQLELERSSFLSHWRELGDFTFPRRPRFFVQDTNRGERRNLKIYDCTATLAARTLRSGMMSGVTSPARPWFRLTTQDPDLANNENVKEWLHLVTDRMSATFLKSNLYNVLPIVYGDMGIFGTAAMSVEEDFQQTIRCYPFSIGSYMIANDERLRVGVVMRDFRMTVQQLVDRFGKLPNGDINWDIFSQFVKNYWINGQRQTWIDVTHVIRENPEYDPQKLHSKYKKFLSCYYETGTSLNVTNYIDDTYDKYLDESGFDYFPVLCPRWETTGEDVYGTECPGMTALGDIKQLQVQEKRIAQAIEKMVNPPMIGPTSLRNQKASILPGDITYLDVRDGMQGFKPAHEINFRVTELEEKQGEIRQRISRSFFEDLFLMLANSDRRDITAREIDERHEEKLLALGPVLEQLNQDLLDPLIDITFQLMLKQGKVPPPPKELQGSELKVEYISILAQAQKVAGIGGIERFAQFVGQIASQGKPEALDKIDADKLVDVYGDLTSVPPAIILTEDQVQIVRAQRQKQQQQAQAAEAAQKASAAAKNLSQADTSGGAGESNALTDLLRTSNAGQIAQGQVQ